MEEESAIFEKIHEYLDRSAPLFFLILSPDGLISECNHFSKALTGRDLSGTDIQDLILDFSGTFDLQKLTIDPLQEHLISIRTADGLPQSVYFSFMQVDEYVLIFGRLDIEELEKMRREVLALNRDLNNITRLLHQKNAQLKRLNEEKNQFLGMAAHDLRKPIGLITAYSEFLIEDASGVLDAEQRSFLNTVHSASFSMKRLVDDFLDISAIESGKFELDLQPANIHEVLEQSLKFNGLMASKKGVRITVEEKNSIPSLMIDAAKIEQVFTNLASNAVEHTDPETEVLITLSFKEKMLTVAIRDSGPGIPPEEREKLFKPFGKTSIKKPGKEKSTGLGLAITRKIIEAHNGNIWVESFPGQGTTVYFNVPVITGES